jgi:hypothetical protein
MASRRWAIQAFPIISDHSEVTTDLALSYLALALFT